MSDQELHIDYQALIDQEFPPHIRARLPRPMMQAYAAVDSLMSDITFLRTVGGRQCRGYLVGAAVDAALIQMIEAGALPFDYQWVPHARPTGMHLRVAVVHQAARHRTSCRYAGGCRPKAGDLENCARHKASSSCRCKPSIDALASLVVVSERLP